MLEVLTTLIAILAVMSLLVVTILIIVAMIGLLVLGAIIGIYTITHATIWWHILFGLVLTVACITCVVSLLFDLL